ncbi:MAG TPA: ABC transporter ATP-binding protein [Chitinophagales bacterium]|nr:ABC transporter ATP-binding protein [Chitinophagales bacterium]
MISPILVQGVEKKFGAVKALNEISFSVDEDELFGLIGADGSGKTTLFRILTSLLIPDSGSATVLGFDVVKDYKQIRRSVGYMPGRFSLYQDLTVQENLEFFATIFGTSINENYELIREIYSQIEPFKNRKAGKLSGGMKQKLALSCALIHAPKVLFLDEPTTGVDPVSRKEFWEMLKRLKEKGITIMVSTPYMDEASLCDRVALIQQGRILSINTPEEIAKQFSKPLFALSSPNKFKLIQDLRAYEFAENVFPFGENVHYSDQRNIPADEIQRDLSSFLSRKKHADVSVQQISPTIEDVFMKLMKQEAA